MVDTVGQPAVWVSQAPATSTSPGQKGQMYQDTTFLYICIGPNLWRRITMETF